jgi:DNA repair exonuclease SbcCD ATPase subunit
MLNIKTITLKNFLSVGNVTQSINFSSPELFLILGENLDLGGNDNRNGVGKTAILNALSYALYGKPLVNIKLENLINKTNGKQLYVTLEFEKNGKNYRIERGRKPTKFLFFTGTEDDSMENEALGENRYTQEDLEEILGLSHTMFKHIVALNTYTEPFLSMSVGNQREIIEQLLGITQLSEKADKLKEQIKLTKDIITQETFRIEAIAETNSRIEQNIKTAQARSDKWDTDHEQKIKDFREAITKLQAIDIDGEIHDLKKIQEIETKQKELDSLIKDRRLLTQEEKRVEAVIVGLEKKLVPTDEKKCHTCGQSIDDETHDKLKEKIEGELEEHRNTVDAIRTGIAELQVLIDAYDIESKPNTFYDSIDDAHEHKTKITTLENQLASEEGLVNPHTENIQELIETGLQDIDYTALNEANDLKKHQDFLLRLLVNKDSFVRKKIISQNLAFLNSKLTEYLQNMGLPHSVTFMPDLSVEITDMGRDLDFDNLSRGERTRLILALSWSFRDVYESLNERINLMFIDELMDNGLDINGVNSALTTVKSMTRQNGRCVYMISHRDELVGRVDNLVRVIKENGFTTIESGVSV